MPRPSRPKGRFLSLSVNNARYTLCAIGIDIAHIHTHSHTLTLTLTRTHTHCWLKLAREESAKLQKKICDQEVEMMESEYNIRQEVCREFQEQLIEIEDAHR